MVLAELTALLESQGYGTQGTDVFYGLVPPNPDSVTSLMEYGGLPSEPKLGTGVLRLTFPHIQALVRGVRDDYDTPRAKIVTLVNIFVSIVNANVGGVRYLAIEPLQDPFLLRRDDNFRCEFVCNFKVTKEPS